MSAVTRIVACLLLSLSFAVMPLFAQDSSDWKGPVGIPVGGNGPDDKGPIVTAVANKILGVVTPYGTGSGVFRVVPSGGCIASTTVPIRTICVTHDVMSGAPFAWPGLTVAKPARMYCVPAGKPNEIHRLDTAGRPTLVYRHDKPVMDLGCGPGANLFFSEQPAPEARILSLGLRNGVLSPTVFYTTSLTKVPGFTGSFAFDNNGTLHLGGFNTVYRCDPGADPVNEFTIRFSAVPVQGLATWSIGQFMYLTSPTGPVYTATVPSTFGLASTQKGLMDLFTMRYWH